MWLGQANLFQRLANEVSYDVDSALTVSKTLLAYVKTAGPSAKNKEKHFKSIMIGERQKMKQPM